MVMVDLRINSPEDVNIEGKRYLVYMKLKFPTNSPPRLQPQHLLVEGCRKLMKKFKQSTTSLAVKHMRTQLEKLMKLTHEINTAKAAKQVKPADGAMVTIVGIDWAKRAQLLSLHVSASISGMYL